MTKVIVNEFFFSLVPKNHKIAVAIDLSTSTTTSLLGYTHVPIVRFFTILLTVKSWKSNISILINASYITNMFIVLNFMKRAYTLLFYRAFLNFLFLLNQKLQTTLHTVWSSKSVQLIIPMQQVSENQPCFCVYLYFFSICTIYLLLLCFLVLL